MTTFAALGDSITLGIGDPVRLAPPPGSRSRGPRGWRGWAVLLSASLPEPDLHIVAGNGACMADLERDQLPAALQLRPDIASVVIGVNDTLRPNFDAARIGASAAHTVGALRAAGAQVLTMRLPDPGRMLGMPDVLARPLARRARQLNEVIDDVAVRFGTLHFDRPAAPERAGTPADRAPVPCAAVRCGRPGRPSAGTRTGERAAYQSRADRLDGH
jgi:lysophospholipase L1-like esterase